jgi:hypothetical protein
MAEEAAVREAQEKESLQLIAKINELELKERQE